MNNLLTEFDIFTLNIVELQYLCKKLEIDQIPVILGKFAKFDSYTEMNQAFAVAATALAEKQYIKSENINIELVKLMQGLAYPTRNLDLRHTGLKIPTRRLMLARSVEKINIAVTRVEDEFTLQQFWCDGTAAALVKPIINFLDNYSITTHYPITNQINFTSVTAPTELVAEKFSKISNLDDIIYLFKSFDADILTATSLGGAMEKILGQTEIVLSATENGNKISAAGAVAIFDTLKGRIVISPSVSLDGTLWSTFNPGGNQQIKTAINCLLDNLPELEWNK